MQPKTHRLLIATHNPGKRDDLHNMLEGLPLELVTLRDLNIDAVAEERSTTYYDNARSKAQTYMRLSGLPVLADDSGLEIDALGGEPGVDSVYHSSEEGRGSLLNRLRNVPDERRIARYRCVVALMRPAHPVVFVEGVLEGRIAHEERGEGGFDFDRFFLLPDRGLTLSELPDSERRRINARARAMMAARVVLQKWMDQGWSE